MYSRMASVGKGRKWYLDSGCGRHMIGDKSMFSCLTSIDGGYVIYEDNGKVKLLVKGDRGAQFCDIHNVLLVDGLMDNLLSASQVCEKWSEVIFESNVFHSKCY